MLANVRIDYRDVLSAVWPRVKTYLTHDKRTDITREIGEILAPFSSPSHAIVYSLFFSTREK